jgi:AhpD family alkylhydroperoxidase
VIDGAIDTNEERSIAMDPRIGYFENPTLMKTVKHLNSVHAAIGSSGLPETIQHLVMLRASQINGCGYCVDMHSKDALHAGESQVRLNLVAAWREATVFSDAERAALELTEEGTRIADAAGGVSDEVWMNAAKHFDDAQLGGLVALIATINTYNRLNVITRQPAGSYEPAS